MVKNIYFSLVLILAVFFGGCASRLEKGWKLFEKGKYYQAHDVWAKEKKQDLSEPIAKADAAIEIIKLIQQVNEADTAGHYRNLLKYSLLVVEKDRWENKDWLGKMPVLQEHIEHAHAKVEEAYYHIILQRKGQEDWKELRKEYDEYSAYCNNTRRNSSERINTLNRFALDALEKIAQNQARADRIKGEFNEQLECSRNNILEEDFAAATKCANDAKGYIKEYPEITFKKEELDFIFLAIRKGINLRIATKIKEFNSELDCGKKRFVEDDYDAALLCLTRAKSYIERHPDISFNQEELVYVTRSTEQGRKIKQAMEDEERKVGGAERKTIEEENRKFFEARNALEKEHRMQEEEKIKMAQGAEKEILKKIENKRRKEVEEKRKIEEESRKWRAFLKEGAPLMPLVTTVLKPSIGAGNLDIGQEQKWQGGSQLPESEDKSLAVEEIYALEIEVPKTHKLNYLRSYFHSQENSQEPNMLGAPVTHDDKRSYYTEKFKGGRYYLEVKNEKSEEKKYEIKGRIYKIPVTH